MVLNYHELTINEPRDSPQRRKQFLVISAIMVIMTIHSSLSAGILSSTPITIGQFPGNSEFTYKSMIKDYAATTGTLRTVAKDLEIDNGNSAMAIDTADLLYSILLDNDANLIPGGQTRFFSGLLLNNSNNASNNEMKKKLLDKNNDIDDTKLTDGHLHSTEVKYEVGYLPKVEAAMITHPFTAGACSAILQSFKIIPKFKKYAKERVGNQQNPLIIISTCSAKQQMCTYYMPLSKHDKFYMGKPTTEDYAKQFTNVGLLEKMGIEIKDGMSIGGINLGNVVRGIKRAIVGGGGSQTKDDKSEL